MLAASISFVFVTIPFVFAAIAFLIAAIALATLMANAMSKLADDPEPDIGYVDEYDPPIAERVDLRTFHSRYEEQQ